MKRTPRSFSSAVALETTSAASHHPTEDETQDLQLLSIVHPALRLRDVTFEDLEQKEKTKRVAGVNHWKSRNVESQLEPVERLRCVDTIATRCLHSAS